MEEIFTAEDWHSYVVKHAGRKGYAHFDHRCDLSDEVVLGKVCDPEYVAKHSFYPFIQFEQINRKFVGKGKPIKIKKRLISYSSHLDSCIFGRYAFILNQYYNRFTRLSGLDGVSIAYRDCYYPPIMTGI